jgi:1-acyl-sn-glycerol-3-phosphate acyltransferase
MGIKISIQGKAKLFHPQGIFFVTNHVSYLDGIIANSVFPLLFIARGDLKAWPFFGIFARLSETIFINRGGSVGLHKEILKISSVLKTGTNVILFPEGTTSSGNTIFPFKSSFFEAPFVSRSLIVPFTINYKKINSNSIDEKNKDLIFWYGEMKFLPHLTGVLGLRNIEVRLNILEPIETCVGQDRKELSAITRKAIEANLVNSTS